MDWYEVVAGLSSLEQCDLIPALPVPILVDLRYPIDPAGQEAQPEFWNVMVLSQGCDLEHGKVPSVLVARYVEWRELRQSEPQNGKKYRSKLRSGQLLPQLVLPPHERPPVQDWAVVDFRELATVEYRYVSDYLNTLDNRLRIRPQFRHTYIDGFCTWLSRPDCLDELQDFDALQ